MIIGNSNAGLKAYRAPDNKSICIYNGFNFKRTEGVADMSIVSKELEIESPYIVGMVASFSIYKDYKTYYKAAEILLSKRKDITFLAIGDHTNSDPSKKLLNGSTGNHFRLLGRRPDVESLVNMMDVCVLSTFTEGISNSILEYMALAKPVVATDGGGTGEIVKDGETGFLVDPEKPEELAEKIELLLNNKGLREKMGEAGQQRVKDIFSIDNMVEKYIFHYRKLLEKHKH
jgi:glycosyltransferase involved in cell wall biosynthesis